MCEAEAETETEETDRDADRCQTPTRMAAPSLVPAGVSPHVAWPRMAAEVVGRAQRAARGMAIVSCQRLNCMTQDPFCSTTISLRIYCARIRLMQWSSMTA